jgi:hypothetical protein
MKLTMQSAQNRRHQEQPTHIETLYVPRRLTLIRFGALVGKTGVKFEREALLMFYNTLNEQRHLTGVMAGLDSEAGSGASCQSGWPGYPCSWP